jgi:hypothetical protein
MDSQLSFSFHLAHVSFAPCSPTLFAFFLLVTTANPPWPPSFRLRGSGRRAPS